MSEFSGLDVSLCAVCGGFGIAPLTDAPDRVDWAVCLCSAGKRWRHSTQLDAKKRPHAVQPLWLTWAGEWGIPVRGPACAYGIDLIENWYPKAVIADIFVLGGKP